MNVTESVSRKGAKFKDFPLATWRLCEKKITLRDS